MAPIINSMRTEFPARKTLTSFVIRTGEAQLVDVEREKALTRQGEIEPVGAPCVSWLGVRLKHEGKTIGVFAVQSYTEGVVYDESDASLLEFASDQIALAQVFNLSLQYIGHGDHHGYFQVLDALCPQVFLKHML